MTTFRYSHTINYRVSFLDLGHDVEVFANTRYYATKEAIKTLYDNGVLERPTAEQPTPLLGRIRVSKIKSETARDAA